MLAVLLELGDQRREVGVARDDDERVDVLLGLGQVHGVDDRRMSAEFLPVWDRWGSR